MVDGFNKGQRYYVLFDFSILESLEHRQGSIIKIIERLIFPTRAILGLIAFESYPFRTPITETFGLCIACYLFDL
jgi:hypothetical protein